jgi:hypothetical protein
MPNTPIDQYPPQSWTGIDDAVIIGGALPFAPPFAGRRWREATDEGQRESLTIGPKVHDRHSTCTHIQASHIAYQSMAQLPLIRPYRGTFSPQGAGGRECRSFAQEVINAQHSN